MGILTNGLSINCFYTKNNFKVAFFLIFSYKYKTKLKDFMRYFQQVTNIYIYIYIYICVILRIQGFKIKG
jgi:hypothetical protein